MRAPLIKEKEVHKAKPIKHNLNVTYFIPDRNSEENEINKTLSGLLYDDVIGDINTKDYAIQCTREFHEDPTLDIRVAPDIIPEVQYITPDFKLVDVKPEQYIGIVENNIATVLAMFKTKFGKLTKTLPKGTKLKFEEEL